MAKLLKDKVILIKGEVSDVSIAIIHSFLEENAIVIFPAKSLQQLNKVKDYKDIHLHKNFISLLIDVYDFDKGIETCEAITERFGKIDIAIQIPEFSSCKKELTEASIDEWNDMMEKGMAPFFMGARIVLGLMKDNLNGMFVHITDSRSFENLKSCALSRVAFSTRIEMSKIFAEEAQRNGIRYYHLWVQHGCGEQALLNDVGVVNNEEIVEQIKNLYQKETYDPQAVLQSFPKQLLHEQA